MPFSLAQQRLLAELATYVERLAPRGGYIFVGVADAAFRQQIERALRKLLPRHCWPQRFALTLAPTLLGALQSHQGHVLSITNLDALLATTGTSQPLSTRPAILHFLNLHREVFHEHRVLALFWVQPCTLTEVLPWQAIDFWDGRAKSFLFEPDQQVIQRPATAGQLLQSAVSHYESATDLLAQRLSQETDTVEIAELQLQAAAAARQAGCNTAARQHAEAALTILRRLGHTSKVAETLAILGRVLDDLGQLQQALVYHQQALELYRKLAHRQGEADQLGNIGGIYRTFGEPHKALQFRQEALAIHRKLGYRQGEASALSNIGIIYRTLREPHKALQLYQEALAIHRELGYRQGEAGALSNIGVIYMDLEEPRNALQFFQEALAIQQELGQLPEVARVLGNIAKLHLQARDMMRAATAIGTALAQPGIEHFPDLHAWLVSVQRQIAQTQRTPRAKRQGRQTRRNPAAP